MGVRGKVEQPVDNQTAISSITIEERRTAEGLDRHEDHAAYIASWIKALRNDKRAIFSAASYAQRAVDFLHGTQTNAPAMSDASAEVA